jgi:cellulose synthase (UDP-forming)
MSAATDPSIGADRQPLRLADARPFDADDSRVHLEPLYVRLLARIVSVGMLAAYAFYLVYRALFTLNPEAPVFSALVYAAEVHGFIALFFYVHQLWALRGRRVPLAERGLTVDVFVVTYNEDVELLRQTVRGAVNLRYPHKTYILDDGRRDAVRALAEELGCGYITRDDNRHAKAGNFNNAFAQTTGDFIATFDADHVPRAAFLERTLGFFRDPKVAFVQVPQQYHNLDSVQHRVNWHHRRLYGEQDVFFNLVMPGKDHWNAAFFCGTGAVIRRAALAPYGGILTGTITEDLHTSIVLHADGWKSVYLNELLVTGLAPMDLKSFEIQRLRWAEGNLKVLGFVNPLTCRGLTPAQRVAYAASIFHWTGGVPKLVYYLAPPWMLFTATFPIAHFDRTFFTIYLAFLATLLSGYSVISRGTGRLLMDELWSMTSFFTLIRALKRMLFGRRAPAVFQVTSKRGGTRGGSEVLPHFALLGFSILALTWSWMGLGFGVRDDVLGAGVASFWAFYNMALMVSVVRMAMRPVQKRHSVRFRAAFPVELPADGDPGTVGMTADLSEGGCTLLWPTPLTRGSRVLLRMHFGPFTNDWQGEVVAQHGRRRDRWAVHGVRFLGLVQEDVDLINDVIFNAVVPDLFVTLSATSLPRQVVRWVVGRARGRFARRPRRVPMSLPVRVRHPLGDFVTTVRDVSGSGLSVTAPRLAQPGDVCEVEVLAPEQRWRGQAAVVRAVPRHVNDHFPMWQWGLRFVSTKDQADLDRLGHWTAA